MPHDVVDAARTRVRGWNGAGPAGAGRADQSPTRTRRSMISLTLVACSGIVPIVWGSGWPLRCQGQLGSRPSPRPVAMRWLNAGLLPAWSFGTHRLDHLPVLQNITPTTCSTNSPHSRRSALLFIPRRHRGVHQPSCPSTAAVREMPAVASPMRVQEDIDVFEAAPTAGDGRRQ